jgi:hypothetical protein
LFHPGACPNLVVEREVHKGGRILSSLLAVTLLETRTDIKGIVRPFELGGLD